MPEGVAGPDGKPVNVDQAAQQEFARAMSAPETDDEQAPAPPKRDKDAPYGYKADGTPRKGPQGRRPKDDDGSGAPRVKAPSPKQAAGPKASVDFTKELTGLTQLAWGVLATISPADAGAVRLVGPGMVTAWNGLAQENAQVARGIEWLTSGSAYGAVVMATAPLVLQILANHGRINPESVSALGVQSPEALAQMTAGDIQEMAEAQAQQVS